MEEIYHKIPCRENQLNDLFDLFGDYDEPLPHSLLISGNMATGKSLCIGTVLGHLGYKHVTINCIECYSPKIMYEAIISGLKEEETVEEVEIKCDSMLDLVNHLNGIHSSGDSKDSYKPHVLVLDRAERLRTMDQSIMYGFLRLRELCNLNICTVFISHLVYENFYCTMGQRQPIKLYFPNYDKEEFFKIIFLHQKSFVHHILSDYNVDDTIARELLKPELFSNFLNAFLSVFYRSCRNLIELRHMARAVFIKYCEPIIKNEIQASNLTKLWQRISPILRSHSEEFYLQISYSKPATQSPNKDNNIELQNYNLENTLNNELMSTNTFAKSFELPYYTKFLLVAAYLASYNSPKDDKRIFMKNHGKQRKRLQEVMNKAKIYEKLNAQLGPKFFTLDRLLAIFYVIVEEKIGLTSNLLAQIATLEELKLITGSKVIDLDSAKYQCIVGYDFILAVAQTVGFNIRKYLV